MRKNKFWASTHPSWSNGVYKCRCKISFRQIEDLNLHILANHTKEEAKELMSWRDFYKFYYK